MGLEEQIPEFHFYLIAGSSGLWAGTSKAGRAPAKEVGLDDLRFHDLRRSAVRNMERAHIPRHVAMQISGHRTESVYRRYDIVVEEDLKAAAKKLADYHEQQRPKLRRVK
jgi:integrase